MMNDSSQPTDEAQVFKGVASRFIQDSSRVHSNLGQDIIITTEDKIRLCLIEHLSRMEKRNAWLTPLGILLTIVIVFPTTTFQSAFFLSAETWEAIFVISGIICLGWLCISVWYARVSSSINDVVANIKQTGIVQVALSDGLKPETKFPILSGTSGVFSYTRDNSWQAPVLCNPIHGEWQVALQSIEGAKWVWIKEKPTDEEAQKGQIVWHQLNFRVEQKQVKIATLTLMVDDWVKLSVNGKFVKQIAMQEHVVVEDLKPYIKSGNNVILMEIENAAHRDSTGESNPTGVIYRLDVY